MAYNRLYAGQTPDQAGSESARLWEQATKESVGSAQVDLIHRRLAKELEAAREMANKAALTPDDSVIPDQPPEMKARVLSWLAANPTIVAAKMAAFERGDYRRERFGAIAAGKYYVSSVADGAPFALVWGEYLPPDAGKRTIILFRITEAADPDAYYSLKMLSQLREDPEARQAAKDYLEQLRLTRYNQSR